MAPGMSTSSRLAAYLPAVVLSIGFAFMAIGDLIRRMKPRPDIANQPAAAGRLKGLGRNLVFLGIALVTYSATVLPQPRVLRALEILVAWSLGISSFFLTGGTGRTSP